MNYWTLIKETSKGNAMYKCICGTIKEQRTRNVKNNNTRSCGCKKNELHFESFKRNKPFFKPRTVSTGYQKIWDREVGDYVFLHRFIMKKELKNNPLLDVHHIDGNKQNNSRENLMVINKTSHSRIEKGWKLIDNKWFKICKGCSLFLEVNEKSFYLRGDNHYFSICIECVRKTNRKKYYSS